MPELAEQASQASVGDSITSLSERMQRPHAFTFMPNLYLVNHARQFKAVCISKNGCSTLKKLAVSDDHPDENTNEWSTRQLHDYLGYQADGRSYVALDSPDFPHYSRFAVFRDPVERAISLYRDKFIAPTMKQGYHKYLQLIGCDLDTFLDYVSLELAKSDPLQMDEHVRPQSLYYDPSLHVDRLVHLTDLSHFLRTTFGVTEHRRINAWRSNPSKYSKPTGRHREKLRLLYGADYDLLEAYSDKLWRSSGLHRLRRWFLLA